MTGLRDTIGSLREGLFAKYVISLVGLVVVVLAVNGALETWISYRATKTTLTDAMGEKAEATARRIEQSISDLERQISWVTRASARTIDEHRADYAQLLNQVPAVSQISLLDGNGREQLRLSRAGVVVDALGINGAQVFTPLRWSEEHFVEQLRHQAPDLVVLAYGTNESIDPKLVLADVERGTVELLARVSRAAPDASCLLLGPPDLARRGSPEHPGWATWPPLLDVVAMQRRVARAAGCAFFDQLEAMGGAGSMAAWAAESPPRAQSDRVHLTLAGYAQVGTAFATDLMRAYDDWRISGRCRPAAKVPDVASR